MSESVAGICDPQIHSSGFGFEPPPMAPAIFIHLPPKILFGVGAGNRVRLPPAGHVPLEHLRPVSATDQHAGRRRNPPSLLPVRLGSGLLPEDGGLGFLDDLAESSGIVGIEGPIFAFQLSGLLESVSVQCPLQPRTRLCRSLLPLAVTGGCG